MEELNEFMDAPIEVRLKVIAGIVSTAFIAWLFCWVVL